MRKPIFWIFLLLGVFSACVGRESQSGQKVDLVMCDGGHCRTRTCGLVRVNYVRTMNQQVTRFATECDRVPQLTTLLTVMRIPVAVCRKSSGLLVHKSGHSPGE